MEPRAIGERQFVDGTTRPVYQDAGGQFIIEEGARVYGQWLIPEEEADLPILLDNRPGSRTTPDGTVTA